MGASANSHVCNYLARTQKTQPEYSCVIVTRSGHLFGVVIDDISQLSSDALLVDFQLRPGEGRAIVRLDDVTIVLEGVTGVATDLLPVASSLAAPSRSCELYRTAQGVRLDIQLGELSTLSVLAKSVSSVRRT